MGRRRGAPATDAPAVPRAPPPDPAVMNELASSTHFTASELVILSQRFADLDSDGDGLVDADEVCAMGEVAMYPLLRRVVSRYNEDKSGALNFSEFSRALSTLSAKARIATSTPPSPHRHLHTSTPAPAHLHLHTCTSSSTRTLHLHARTAPAPALARDHLVIDPHSRAAPCRGLLLPTPT